MSEEKRVDIIKNGIRSRIRQVQDTLLQEIKNMGNIEIELLEEDIEISISEGRLFISSVQEILTDAVANINVVFEEMDENYQLLYQELVKVQEQYSASLPVDDSELEEKISSPISDLLERGKKAQIARDWGYNNPYGTKKDWEKYGMETIRKLTTVIAYWDLYVKKSQEKKGKEILKELGKQHQLQQEMKKTA